MFTCAYILLTTEKDSTIFEFGQVHSVENQTRKANSVDPDETVLMVFVSFCLAVRVNNCVW